MHAMRMCVSEIYIYIQIHIHIYIYIRIVFLFGHDRMYDSHHSTDNVGPERSIFVASRECESFCYLTH